MDPRPRALPDLCDGVGHDEVSDEASAGGALETNAVECDLPNVMGAHRQVARLPRVELSGLDAETAPHLPPQAFQGRLDRHRLLRALETFFLEVSAGRIGGADEVSPPTGHGGFSDGVGPGRDSEHRVPSTPGVNQSHGTHGPRIANVPNPAEQNNSSVSSQASRRDARLTTTGAGKRSALVHATKASPASERKPIVSRETQPTASGSSKPNASSGAARDVVRKNSVPTPVPSEPRGGNARTSKKSPLKRGASSASKRRAQRKVGSATRGTPHGRPKTSPLTISLVAHAVLLVALSVATLATQLPEEDFTLVASDGPMLEELETLTDFDVDMSELDELDETADPVALIDPGASLGADIDPSSALADGLSDVGASGDALAAAAGLFAGAGQGDARDGLGLGGEATAQFFGTRVEGRRILFLLDNSGSMQGGRLETVIAELQNTVASLAPDQRFYVVFYSDDLYPLFYPDSAVDFVKPGEAMRERLGRWLESVELCYGDVVDEAIYAALRLNPDVVFLLSDGKIMSSGDLELLLSPDKGFPVHTVGVGLGASTTAREKLQRIADANAGSFREAPIAADLRAASAENPRPYRRKGPGPVWGRRVGR
ncbi:MAG: VWA domain-containing protein [Planctomycetales bacterium]|nr:VWA domain-containing protein [Planctomycetales bacterium]